MSVAQVTAPGRGTSPLMSNNPFRNHINSFSGPAAPAEPEPEPEPEPSRPISTNPFLDTAELNRMSNGTGNPGIYQDTLVNNTADIFSSMKVQDNQNELQPTRSRQANPGPRRPEFREHNSMRAFPRPPGHKVSMSEEEQRRVQPRARADLDIFADPLDTNRDRERRPRRNSESSIRDMRPPMDEEERRRRDRERRTRESRRNGSKSTKPNKKLDVIDKLDVTSIYGMGLFHHDGPFDACNPHRNRKKEKYAPMQAFPKDSVNMVMGGSGPVNKRMDYDKFHGYGPEAQTDFNKTATIEEGPPDVTRAYNPTSREAVHGDESVGLGTSTFLEGAPASRAAIQRRESEYDTTIVEDRPGLSRKKSLAQKIRGVRPRDRLASPEGRLGPASPPLTGQSDSGVNPFFKNYDQKESTSTSIQFAENQPKPNRARAPSSPKRNELERRNTSESMGEEPKPTGLLGRMKSLKTSKRPARRDTSG